MKRYKWQAAAAGLMILTNGMLSAQGDDLRADASSLRSRQIARRPVDDHPQEFSDQPRNGVPPTMHGPNSMSPRQEFGPRPRMIRDYSWIYIDPAPEPRKIKVHDIVVIVVDEKSEVTENSLFNRQKMGQLKLELKEFIRIDDKGNLANAAANSPSVDSNMQQMMNSRAILQNREGMKFRIAAMVADIQPNGNLVLEARKTIRSNWNVWEYSLTGIVRPEDVLANNTVLSENLAMQNIRKKERGRVRDATRRGWVLTTYDFLSPF